MERRLDSSQTHTSIIRPFTYIALKLVPKAMLVSQDIRKYAWSLRTFTILFGGSSTLTPTDVLHP
jgi:hypothetical protein